MNSQPQKRISQEDVAAYKVKCQQCLEILDKLQFRLNKKRAKREVMNGQET